MSNNGYNVLYPTYNYTIAGLPERKKKATVDIYIRETKGNKPREIRIPWLPEYINFDTGEATVASYDLLNVGEVIVPSGVGLCQYSWESIFPGIGRTESSYNLGGNKWEYRDTTGMGRGDWKEPKHYEDILNDWKKNRTELNLLVTGYPINKTVYLTNYSGKASGGFGDVEYSIVFKEKRTIKVTSTYTAQDMTFPSMNAPAKTRPTTTETTYTVKTGDTLWEIAEAKLGSGTDWSSIYKANKTVIENTAKKFGKSSSSNGHWIYPGTTLTIKL